MGDLLYSAIEIAFGKKALLKKNPTTKKLRSKDEIQGPRREQWRKLVFKVL